jgi:hypothetical protein
MHNISSIKESRWPQPLSIYQVVYKAIVWHNTEILNWDILQKGPVKTIHIKDSWYKILLDKQKHVWLVNEIPQWSTGSKS